MFEHSEKTNPALHKISTIAGHGCAEYGSANFFWGYKHHHAHIDPL
jgi:hypothetical protein